MKDYAIVSGEHKYVVESVTDLLNHGWELVGGLSINSFSENKRGDGVMTIKTLFAQALVKDDKPQEIKDLELFLAQSKAGK